MELRSGPLFYQCGQDMVCVCGRGRGGSGSGTTDVGRVSQMGISGGCQDGEITGPARKSPVKHLVIFCCFVVIVIKLLTYFLTFINRPVD